jgi:hypothetical protein
MFVAVGDDNVAERQIIVAVGDNPRLESAMISVAVATVQARSEHIQPSLTRRQSEIHRRPVGYYPATLNDRDAVRNTDFY